MATEDFKEKLLDFWDRVKELAGTAWEEIVDRSLDLWDSFRRLDQRLQIGIAGGAGLVILLAILIPLIYTPGLDLIAVQNTSGVLGEGNYITVKNNSDKTYQDLNLILDDKYIYYVEKIAPDDQIKLLSRDFHYRLAHNEFGEAAGKDLVGEKLKVICRQGETEVMLVEKKGFFQ